MPWPLMKNIFLQKNPWKLPGQLSGMKSKNTMRAAGFTPKVILEKHGRCEEILLPADDHFSNMLAHIAHSLDTGEFSGEYPANHAFDPLPIIFFFLHHFQKKLRYGRHRTI